MRRSVAWAPALLTISATAASATADTLRPEVTPWWQQRARARSGRRGARLHRPRPLALLRRPDRRSTAAGAPPRVDATCPGARYGLGLAALRTPCGTAVGHTGNLLGTVSAAWSTPDGSRRVVAMTNSYPLSPAADTAFRRLLDAAFCG